MEVHQSQSKHKAEAKQQKMSATLRKNIQFKLSSTDQHIHIQL